MSIRLASVLLLALLLVGCASGSATEAPATQALILSTATPTAPPPTATATAQPAPDLPAAQAAVQPVGESIPAAAQGVIGQAIDDLAGTLDVPSESVLLLDVEAAAWAGAELDCDAVVLDADDASDGVSGYRILLAVDEARYVYRADEAGEFVACATAADDTAGDTLIVDPVVNALVDLASQHLAERLDLPQRRVFVEGVAAYDWPDNRLGCALAGQVAEAETVVPGYQITLRVGTELYYYHTDYRQVIFCPAEAVDLPEEATPAVAEATVTP